MGGEKEQTLEKVVRLFYKNFLIHYLNEQLTFCLIPIILFKKQKSI